MEQLEPLVWHCEKRKVNDLIPWERNPRQMTKKQAKDLEQSIKNLNLIEIPAIDTDETLVGGHQRCKILQLLGRGKEEIDVRVPNRKLTEEEFTEANLRLNHNLGEWDLDLLASFDPSLLLDVGFQQFEINQMFQLDMNDPEKEWQNMPEFEREPLAIQSIHIHFKTREDVFEFARIINQKITDKTRSLWFPEKKDE